MKRAGPRYSSFITATLRTIRSNPTMVVSLDEALRLNMTQYRTGEPCEYGHRVWRYVRGGRCTDCARGVA